MARIGRGPRSLDRGRLACLGRASRAPVPGLSPARRRYALRVSTRPPSLFDRWTLERLEAARRESVPEADAVASAARLADAGDIAGASAALSAAFERAEDIRLLFLGFQFYFRTGDHASAEAWTLKRLRIVEREGETVHVARACTNLGLIHLATGRVGSARPLMERAVEIDELLGNLEGLARDLGNLANVHEALGELETAWTLNERSLEIATRIGAAEIAAGKKANMGDIAHALGRKEEARALWRNAMDDFARLGIEKHRRECEAKLAG